MKVRLSQIYKKLYAYFGPQHWWPARTPFEVIVGAILTQNTNWQNVSLAINNLRNAGVLNPVKLYRLPEKKLAQLIRPSGYYNIKAKRIKHFLKFFFKNYQGNTKKMFKTGPKELREEILGVKGIGPETADSILLYAGALPIFVVDAYTKRILSRHGIISEDAHYQQVQNLFMRRLKSNARLFNEFHALLVKLGKEYCRKNIPRCRLCPLKEYGKHLSLAFKQS
jgi:endonuclease-3 related protein